jgi:hypothetical protein
MIWETLVLKRERRGILLIQLMVYGTAVGSFSFSMLGTCKSVPFSVLTKSRSRAEKHKRYGCCCAALDSTGRVTF